LHLFRARHKLQSGKVRPQFREATGAGRSGEASRTIRNSPAGESAAKLLTKNEARRIAANVAKPPELLKKS
jgi:hypothetical protein